MDGHNIPHMQLFYQLKQKFPDLKDNDVNESIQKVKFIIFLDTLYYYIIIIHYIIMLCYIGRFVKD